MSNKSQEPKETPFERKRGYEYDEEEPFSQDSEHEYEWGEDSDDSVETEENDN